MSTPNNQPNHRLKRVEVQIPRMRTRSQSTEQQHPPLPPSRPPSPMVIVHQPRVSIVPEESTDDENVGNFDQNQQSEAEEVAFLKQRSEQLVRLMQDLQVDGDQQYRGYTSRDKLPPLSIIDTVPMNAQTTIDHQGNVIPVVDNIHQVYTGSALQYAAQQEDSVYLNIVDALANLRITPPPSVTHEYDQGWITILHTMFHRMGIPTDREGVSQYIILARDYAGDLLANPSLRLDWEMPVFINDEGVLEHATRAVPVLRSHIGRNSVEGSGVITTDLVDMPVSSSGGCSFLNWLLDARRSKASQIQHVLIDHCITINSTIHYDRTSTSFAGHFDAHQQFNNFMPVNTRILPRTIKLVSARKIDTIQENTYSEYVKSRVLNKATMSAMFFDILRPTPQQINDLTVRMTSYITTAFDVFDNVYMYTKLFCNIYARARFELEDIDPQLPIPADNNSGLRYFQFGEGQVLNFDNLLNFANQQYIPFFQTRNAGDNFITLLEILGYEGMYFTSPADEPVCPWQSLTLPKINIVYFVFEGHVHQGPDMFYHTLLGETIKLATLRGEGDEMKRGLCYAMELIPGKVYRHLRLANNQQAAVVPDDNERRRLDGRDQRAPNVLPEGGPRPRCAVYAVPPNGWAIDHGDNPNSPRFQGDGIRNDNGRSYDRAHYAYLLLDASFQHQFNVLPKPYGINWMLELLNVYHKKQPIPDIFTSIANFDNIQFVQYMTLGYAMIRTAASTINIVNNVAGYALDEYARNVPRRRFQYFFDTSYTNVHPMPGGYVRYYDLIKSTIHQLTGHDYTVNHIQRDFNQKLGYGIEHLDRYGVYHFISGSLPLVGGNVLALHNFIMKYPREWGIFKPGVTATLMAVLYHELPTDQFAYAYTHQDDVFIEKHHMYPATLTCQGSYSALMINALRQSILRNRNAAAIRYMTANSIVPLKNMHFHLQLVADTPNPVLIVQASLYVPGSFITFNWRNNFYLAPCFEMPMAIFNEILNYRYGKINLYGAGLPLYPELSQQLHPYDTPATPLLAPWQQPNIMNRGDPDAAKHKPQHKPGPVKPTKSKAVQRAKQMLNKKKMTPASKQMQQPKQAPAKEQQPDAPPPGMFLKHPVPAVEPEIELDFNNPPVTPEDIANMPGRSSVYDDYSNIYN